MFNLSPIVNGKLGNKKVNSTWWRVEEEEEEEKDAEKEEEEEEGGGGEIRNICIRQVTAQASSGKGLC